MLTKELLSCVLDIGEQMLVSGAEVNRVEDSIRRICESYNAKRVDVFTITSSIVVSLQREDGNVFTQTRRIYKHSNNLDKVDKLNNLSRYICSNTPEPEYIINELEEINNVKTYNLSVEYIIYAIIAGVFTIFFGGSLADAVVSSAIAIVLKLSITLAQRVDKNILFTNIICSFVIGLLAILSVNMGIGKSLEKIIIGNIMLMIPGIAFTNSIRDIIGGDTIAGLFRLCEAIVIALSIAVGLGIASIFFGGILK
jgi:uncharacterized membrane protein YjjP (DUF1212 family)